MSPAPLRIGIVNLMPEAEKYAAMLLGALNAAGGYPFVPNFIRLKSHGYASSDAGQLARYHSYADLLARGPLDGLVLTGAPVEELPFGEVRYFDELRALLEHARAHVPSTLGLCWGGLALAHLLGIAKRPLHPKLFGLVPVRAADGAPAGYCAQSRHAGLDPASLELAQRAGHVRVLARCEDGDTTWLESPDGRWVMHLGHPEYTPERLAFEHARDQARGRSDVAEPVNLSRIEARAGHTAHARALFGAWFARLSAAREPTSRAG